MIWYSVCPLSVIFDNQIPNSVVSMLYPEEGKGKVKTMQPLAAGIGAPSWMKNCEED